MKHKFRASFHDFHLDSHSGLSHKKFGEIKLPTKELSMLVTLVQNAGNLVSKEALVQTVWGDYTASDSSIARCISSLRSCLKAAVPQSDSLIQMVYGKGYKFVGKVTSSASFLCEESFMVLINTSPDFILFKDCDGRWLHANTAALRAFDLTARDWQNKTDTELADLLPAPYRIALNNCSNSDLIAWQQATPSKSFETVYLTDGTEHHYDVVKFPLFNSDGSRNVLIIFGRDITDLLHARKQHEHSQQELNHRLASMQSAAYNDPLTQLPNRTLLQDHFQQALAAAHRHNTRLAVLFLDVDHFKSVNDQFGHAVGDQLLQQIAQRLCKCVRAVDTVSRIGGDEFVVVLTELHQLETAGQVAEKILQTIAQPMIIQSLTLQVTISIGVAVFPNDGEDFGSLLGMADLFMYQAKNQGKNTYRFSTAWHDNDMQHDFQI